MYALHDVKEEHTTVVQKHFVESYIKCTFSGDLGPLPNNFKLLDNLNNAPSICNN